MATDIIARGMITEYKSGTNISFRENDDGSVTISASGNVSSEDTVARETIDSHKLDKNNPHNVTAEQVGLGNVDNTADLDKPISTAVQTALDNKANTKHTHKKSDITDFPNSLPANGGDADTVNNHTVDSDVPAGAVFTDTTNSDITASGNPVQLDGLQGGVPFNEVTVSGKNLIPSDYMTKSGTYNGVTVTVKNDGRIALSGTATSEGYILTILMNYPLIGGKKYTFNCNKQYDVNTFNLGLVIRDKNGNWKTSLDSFPKTITADDGDYISSWRLWTYNGVEYSAENIEIQLELGDTATEYEPPITGRELTVNVNGTEYTITPDSNPYVIPNDIRQQYGLNVVSVSEGELSVVGVRKNAAVKKIWDKIDELTTAIIVSNGETIE